jgi:DNA-binding CsgD family transcriptional regulator
MFDASEPRPGLGFRFHSNDLDEFREVIRQSIRPCRFRARAERYQARLQHHSVADVGFSVLSVGPPIDVQVNPVEDSYLLQISLRGSFEASCLGPERAYREGDVNVVNPSAPLRVSMHPGTQILIVRIAKSMLEEHVRLLRGTHIRDSRPLLPESLPLERPEAASLRRYLSYLHAESMDPESLLHDGRANRASRQMLASLMLALTDADAAPVRPDVVDHVRRAEAFIDGHVGEDIGLVDIVRSSGVDARTLDAGFHRLRGAGPLSWLDQRRAARDGGSPSPLSTRELEIARLVGTGLNNHEIASCLSISRNTVKDALKRIFRKMEVDSRSELVARLADAGLLS